MMNGMTVGYYNFTMGLCKCEMTEDGVCFTCTSGDIQCCRVIQACCDCLSSMLEAGCTCCVLLNNTPVCCGVQARRRVPGGSSAAKQPSTKVPTAVKSPRKKATGGETVPGNHGDQKGTAEHHPSQPEKSQSSCGLPVEGYTGIDSSSVHLSTETLMKKQASDTCGEQLPLKKGTEQVMVLGAVQSFRENYARCLVDIHGARLPVDIPREALEPHGLQENMRFQWVIHNDGGPIHPQDIKPLPNQRLSGEELMQLQTLLAKDLQDPASDVWNSLEEDD
jgi:hypothetical protein